MTSVRLPVVKGMEPWKNIKWQLEKILRLFLVISLKKINEEDIQENFKTKTSLQVQVENQKQSEA